MPRAHNKHADTLASMASKIDIPDKAMDVKITKKTFRVTTSDLIPVNPIDKQDWLTSTI